MANADTLATFLHDNASIAVVSGAGMSTASGIPDYRDRNGDWKQAQPMQFGEFVGSEEARRRYWARSYVGWQRFSKAAPNAAHQALARLESVGKVDTLITQNVDGLHHAAGSRRVIDLHGKLSNVRCLGCDTVSTRADFQDDLRNANPGWHAAVHRYKPDGDAELATSSHENFVVPDCRNCGGVIKADVVMFGENVPKQRVADAMQAVERADALLVVGSSLMVYSGFRFAKLARDKSKPIAIVNLGRTRADDIADLKVEQDCSAALDAALAAGLTERGKQ